MSKTVHQKKELAPAVDRRNNYRIVLPSSLSTQMTILSLNENDLSIGSTEVLVQDIGLGGLKFTSHLRLTSHETIIYGFQSVVLETPIKLNGKIVWEQEIYQGFFEYGVQFLIEESERDKLALLLNSLTVDLRNNPETNNGDFITINPITYLRKKFLKKPSSQRAP